VKSFDLSQSENLPSVTIESLAFQSFATTGERQSQVQLTLGERQSLGTNLIATLPIPDQMQFSSDWNWSVEDRSIVQNLVSNVGDLRGSSFEDFQKAITNIAGRTAIRAGDLFGTRSAGQNLGVAQNTLKEIFFDGVQNRTFTWEWKFAPRSPQEYVRTKEFIALTKRAASPEKTAGALFRIPDSFRISFNDIDLPVIKECACTNISDNYSDSGMIRIHSDGNPAFINLAMTFTEIDINDRNDF